MLNILLNNMQLEHGGYKPQVIRTMISEIITNNSDCDMLFNKIFSINNFAVFPNYGVPPDKTMKNILNFLKHTMENKFWENLNKILNIIIILSSCD